MFSPLVVTFLGLMFVVCLDQVHGATFFGEAPCPDNHKPGDVWYLEQCMVAKCHADYYTIRSCSVVQIDYDSTLCYLQYNNILRYPYYCTPTVVCFGDKGFDLINLVD